MTQNGRVELDENMIVTRLADLRAAGEYSSQLEGSTFQSPLTHAVALAAEPQIQRDNDRVSRAQSADDVTDKRVLGRML